MMEVHCPKILSVAPFIDAASYPWLESDEVGVLEVWSFLRQGASRKTF